MSGFYLTKSILSGGFSAAEESVKLFDDLFGNTEPSRALSSIISLVRRELVQDVHFTPSHHGKIATLSALTKALTAFACLQNATHRRSMESFKLKVIYDCTVINNRKGRRSHDNNGTGKVFPPSTNKRRAASYSLPGDDEQLMSDVRQAKDNGHNWRDDLNESELAQLRQRTHTRARSMFSQTSNDSEDDLVYELGQMVGDVEQSETGQATDPQMVEQLKEALKQVEDEKGYRDKGTDYEVEVETEDSTTLTTIRTTEETRSISPCSVVEWPPSTDVETVAQASLQNSEDHPVEGRRQLKVRSNFLLG